MKCYVIHLERATDRKETCINEFQNTEIEFEFVSGVDWRDLTDQDIEDNVDSQYLANERKFKRPPVHGGLACWLSHRKVWRTALANEEELIAVFEDDCQLAKETKSALVAIESIFQNEGHQFDIVFLYNGKTRNPFLPVYKINDKFTLGIVKCNSMGAVGYVITLQAIKILLKEYPIMVDLVDFVLHLHAWWKNGLRTYTISPQVVYHGEPSEIHHSYNEESYGPRLSAKTLPHKNRKTLRYRIHLLLTQGIPKRLAFRQRMKKEIK